jgi:hypothetical protein
MNDAKALPAIGAIVLTIVISCAGPTSPVATSHTTTTTQSQVVYALAVTPLSDSSYGAPDGGAQITVTAKLSNAGGASNANAPIVFTSLNFSANGDGVYSGDVRDCGGCAAQDTVNTDSSGTAVINWVVGGADSGIEQLTVQSAAAKVTDTVDLTILPPVPIWYLTVMQSDTTAYPASDNLGEGTTVTAVLSNSANLSNAGYPISFTVLSGTNDGVYSGIYDGASSLQFTGNMDTTGTLTITWLTGSSSGIQQLAIQSPQVGSVVDTISVDVLPDLGPASTGRRLARPYVTRVRGQRMAAR